MAIPLINMGEEWPPAKRRAVIDDELLVCSICLSFPKDRMMQCVHGHLVCFECTCSLLEQKCPVCRHIGAFSRCLLAEHAVKNTPWECEFGCETPELTLGDQKTHKDACKYRPFECPVCEDMTCISNFESHALQHLSRPEIECEWETMRSSKTKDVHLFSKVGREIVVIDCFGVYDDDVWLRVTPTTPRKSPLYFWAHVKIKGTSREMKTFHSANCNPWKNAGDFGIDDVSDRRIATVSAIQALVDSRRNGILPAVVEIRITSVVI